MVPIRSIDFIDLLTLSRASKKRSGQFEMYNVIHFKFGQKVLSNLLVHLYKHLSVNNVMSSITLSDDQEPRSIWNKVLLLLGDKIKLWGTPFSKL